MTGRDMAVFFTVHQKSHNEITFIDHIVKSLFW